MGANLRKPVKDDDALGSFDQLNSTVKDALEDRFGPVRVVDVFPNRVVFEACEMADMIGPDYMYSMYSMLGMEPAEELPEHPFGDMYQCSYSSDAAGVVTLGDPLPVSIQYNPVQPGTDDSTKATWTTAVVNGLPDSSFALIESGGSKDSDGRTAPRSLRHFPYKDDAGKVDLPHLRNALTRLPESKLSPADKSKAKAVLDKAAAANGVGAAAAKSAQTAVKALAGGAIEGLGIPFGGPFAGKDHDGEYFHAGTDFAFAWYDQRPIIYHHALNAKGTLGQEKIGSQTSYDVRPDGIWIKGQLDLTAPLGAQAWAMAQKGQLFWSSGSIGHLVKKGPGGRIDRWPWIENSLTPTPSNPYAVAGPSVKAAGLVDPIAVIESCRSELAAKAGRVLSASSKRAIEAALQALQELLDSVDTRAAADTSTKARQLNQNTLEKVTKMDTEELVALLDKRDADKEAAAVKSAEVKATEESKVSERVKTEVEAAIKAANEEAIKGARQEWLADMAAKGRIALFPQLDESANAVVGSKYDGLKAADLAFMAAIMQTAVKTAGVQGRRSEPSEELLKACAIKAFAEHAKGDLDGEAIKALTTKGIKANELMQATLAGSGDEWVPDLFSADLWRIIRLNAAVAKLIRFIPMPSNPYELPIQGADPTWYNAAETVSAANLLLNALNTPSSKAGTGKQTLTAGKLGAVTFFSGEFEEDSIIPVAAILREQMEQSGQHTLDFVILNGDTDLTASTNINLIDATPAATVRYSVFNGLRKQALVTTTTNSLSIGTLTARQFLSLLAFMGTNGIYGVDKTQTPLIVDSGTYFQILALAESLAGTLEGGFATFINGDVERIWGRQLIVSQDLALSNTAGKVSNTGSNNTKGSIVTFNTSRWLGGYRREMNLEIFPIPGADAKGIVAYVRPALVAFDADCSAVGYNVTV